jgi:hypothetical protein
MAGRKGMQRVAVEAGIAAAVAALLLGVWAMGPRGGSDGGAGPGAKSAAPAAGRGAGPGVAPPSQGWSAGDRTVSGHVVDEQGRGLAGARVTLRELMGTPASVPANLEPGSGELGVLPGSLPFPDEVASFPASGPALAPGSPATAPSVPGRAGRVAETTSAADGGFTITLAAEHLELRARHPERPCSEAVRLALQAGSRTSGVRIALSRGTLVHGRVRDPSGAPLAGAVVAPAFADSVGAVSDARGEYRLGALCGRVRLEARLPGRRMRTLNVELRGEEERALDLTLESDGAWLRGQVLDARERPLRGARVVVGPSAGSRESWPSASTVSDERGDFRVSGLGPGACRVEVQHEDYLPFVREEVHPGTLVKVRLTLGGGIAGLVREQRTGATAAGATLEVRPVGGGGGAGTEVRLARGKFEARRLLPGRWRLTARAPGYASRVLEVDVPAALRPGEITIRDLLLELERGAVISGEVRDERGERLQGVRLSLAGRSGVSGPRGEFRLEELPGGAHVLRASRDGFAPAEVPVSLRPGDEQRGLDVRLSRTGGS